MADVHLTPATIDGLPFERVIGETPKVGKGTALFTYAVYVEEKIKIRKREFAHKIDTILADRRGWIKGGKVSFQRVSVNPNTYCILATPDTVDKLCYPLNTEGKVSCCQGIKVVINHERWQLAVPHWTGSLKGYRQMLVNHEFGHRIGHGHGFCPGPGMLAPVDCGGTVEHFHHRDPATKKIAVARMTRYSEASILAEVAKCDLLCGDCHRKRHAVR